MKQDITTLLWGPRHLGLFSLRLGRCAGVGRCGCRWRGFCRHGTETQRGGTSRAKSPKNIVLPYRWDRPWKCAVSTDFGAWRRSAASGHCSPEVLGSCPPSSLKIGFGFKQINTEDPSGWTILGTTRYLLWSSMINEVFGPLWWDQHDKCFVEEFGRASPENTALVWDSGFYFNRFQSPGLFRGFTIHGQSGGWNPIKHLRCFVGMVGVLKYFTFFNGPSSARWGVYS